MVEVDPNLEQAIGAGEPSLRSFPVVGDALSAARARRALRRARSDG